MIIFNQQLRRWHRMYKVSRHQTTANFGQIIYVQPWISCFAHWYPGLSHVSDVQWECGVPWGTHSDWNLNTLLLVGIVHRTAVLWANQDSCLTWKFELCCGKHLYCGVFSQLANTYAWFLELNTSFSIMAEGSHQILNFRQSTWICTKQNVTAIEITCI